MAENGRISANVGDERKERLKQLSDKRFNGSLTAALCAAIDTITTEEARERASLPPSVLASVNYIRLIANTGSSASDWAIIKQEVDKLWKSTQS